MQADQERADRQREYMTNLSQLAEETAEYESSEATSLATTSTMEGEHWVEAGTPQECLSPEQDTPTPTPPHPAPPQHQQQEADTDIQLLRLQLKEVRPACSTNTSHNLGA